MSLDGNACISDMGTSPIDLRYRWELVTHYCNSGIQVMAIHFLNSNAHWLIPGIKYNVNVIIMYERMI